MAERRTSRSEAEAVNFEGTELTPTRIVSGVAFLTMSAPWVRNGKVSTREFYDALLKQNEQMQTMERRILDRLEGLPVVAKQVEINKEEIDNLRGKSNLIDLGITVLTIFGSILGISLGPRQ